MPRIRTIATLTVAILLGALPARAQTLTPHQQLARDVFRELIETNTTPSAGSTTRAAEFLARRLRDAGFPEADVQVIGPDEKNRNLVARLRGRQPGRKPILLMAHLDVVEAEKADWSEGIDPFAFTERDGYYYGRGTTDNKAGAATLVATMIRLKREGWVPDRDLVMVLTGDEETDARDGIDWLLKNRRELIDAEYALNTDAGGVTTEGGKPTIFGIQASEKVFLSFRLEVTNPGGHSSRPVPDNAIYRLSDGLGRLARFQFPVTLGEVTRLMLERSAPRERPELGAAIRRMLANERDSAAVAEVSRDAGWNAVMRTTCVATMLEGGHAENALPQRARATVNCRILPGHSPDSVEAALGRVLADTAIHIARMDTPVPSPPSPLRPEVIAPIERLAQRHFPGTVFIPHMSAGATDGLYVRNAGIPVYGVSALAEDANEARAHGRDERVLARAFFDALGFWYDMVKLLGSARERLAMSE